MSEPGTRLRKHSVTLAGHATSISIEDSFWDALKDIARQRGTSLNALIAEVDEGRDSNLSSSLRVFVLNSLRDPE